MAIDLVDGRAGTPHIDGDDLGDFKAGFCGTGGYVLKTGDLLEATQDDANHVTVGTGSMIMPGTGRHVRVTSPEQVTVTSGTQGQSRRDLIVMRVTQESQGSSTIEVASLVCVRGTPVSYGTPQDPAVEDGDLPLYRVSLEGATASAPVAVFDVLTPISELRDSVSRSAAVACGSVEGTNADGALAVSVAKPEGKSGLPLVTCSVRVPDNAENSRIFDVRVWSIADAGNAVNVMFRVFRHDTDAWTGRQGVRVDYVLAWP